MLTQKQKEAIINIFKERLNKLNDSTCWGEITMKLQGEIGEEQVFWSGGDKEVQKLKDIE